jgi:gas vesicle protein
MKNIFKKGIILGGILAAGAVVGLTMTKGGKQLTAELQKDIQALHKIVKKSLHRMEDITKDGFDELVKTTVEEYAQKKKIARDTKDDLIAALQSSWSEMEQEYMNERDEQKK